MVTSHRHRNDEYRHGSQACGTSTTSSPQTQQGSGLHRCSTEIDRHHPFAKGSVRNNPQPNKKRHLYAESSHRTPRDSHHRSGIVVRLTRRSRSRAPHDRNDPPKGRHSRHPVRTRIDTHSHSMKRCLLEKPASNHFSNCGCSGPMRQQRGSHAIKGTLGEGSNIKSRSGDVRPADPWRPGGSPAPDASKTSGYKWRIWGLGLRIVRRTGPAGPAQLSKVLWTIRAGDS